MHIYVPKNFTNIYSTKYQCKQVNEIILKYVDRNSIITDCTGGIGGNSYFFCKDFRFVNIIEKDYLYFNLLKKNLHYYKNNIFLIGTYNIFKYIIRQDVIFIDPPWGGKNYKNSKNIDLFLDGENVLNIIESLYNYATIICLKVPNNFNFSNLSYNFWNIHIYTIYTNKININKIYKLIVFFK